MPAETILQTRRGSTIEWIAANPVLEDGEHGYDNTLKRYKMGNGATAWLSLPYEDFSPQHIEVCVSGNRDFTSVGAAIASISDNSATKPYIVKVFPGIYNEAPFTMKKYVSVIGEGSYFNTILKTTDDNSHFITGIPYAELRGLAVEGPIGTGNAAIYFGNVLYADRAIPFKVIEVAIRKGYYGVYAYSDGQAGIHDRTKIHCFNVANWYAGADPVNTFFKAEGKTNLVMMSCALMSGRANTATGITLGLQATSDAANIPEITMDLCSFYACTDAIHMEGQVGQLAYARLTACSFTGGVTAIDAKYANMNIAGSVITDDVTTNHIKMDGNSNINFSGVMNKSRLTVGTGGKLSASFSDHTINEEGQVVFGELWLGNDKNTAIPLKDYGLTTYSTGWVSGGEVTEATGFDINIAAGTGYINTGTGVVKVSWGATTKTLSASLPSQYVYVDSTGTVFLGTSEPDYKVNILLAIADTNATTLTILADHKIPINNFIPRHAEYLEDVIGPVSVTGGVASINGSNNLKIDVTGGEYFRIHNMKTLVGGTQVPLHLMYRNLDGTWTHNETGIIDPSFYDNGSGTLAPITAGKYKRDLMFVHEAGGVEYYHIIYGQTLFDTEEAAKVGVNPICPDSYLKYSMRCAAIITLSGASTIAAIVDQRPKLGQMASASATITAHNDLTGRDSDVAHPQYAKKADGVIQNINAINATNGTSVYSSGTVNIVGGGLVDVQYNGASIIINGANPITSYVKQVNGISGSIQIAGSDNVTVSTLNGSIVVQGKTDFPYVNTSRSSLFQQSSLMTNYQPTGNYLTTAMASNAGSNFVNTSQSSLFQKTADMSLYQASGNYLTTAMASNAGTNFLNTSQSSVFVQTSQSSLFQHTSATSNITSNAFPTANSSNLVNTSQSSLFQQTSATSNITSNAFPTANSTNLVNTSVSSLFQQTSATSNITSNAFPTANSTNLLNTSQSSLFQHTSAMTNYIGTNYTTHTHSQQYYGLGNTTGQSSSSGIGTNVSIQGAGMVSVGLSGGAIMVSAPAQSIFVQTSQSSLFQHTSATSAITANALNTSQSSLFQATSLMSNYQPTGNYLTTAMASNAGTNFLSVSQSSLFQHTSATSNITSNAFPTANSTNLVNTSQSSLFQQTSATSNITSNAFPTANSSNLMNTSVSSLFQQTSGMTAYQSTGNYLTTAANSTHTHSQNYYGAGNTTGQSSSSAIGTNVTINGGGIISVGMSLGSILISAPVQTDLTNHAHTQYLTTAMASNAGSNFVSVSQSSLFQHTSATSAITSNAFPTANSTNLINTSQSSLFQQTSNSSLFQQSSLMTNYLGTGYTTHTHPDDNTFSYYGAGNTTQVSSMSLVEGALTFEGAGIASVGMSNNRIVISVPAGGGAGDGVNVVMMGTTGTTGTAFSSLSGTVFLNGAGGIIVSQNNSNQIVISNQVDTKDIQYFVLGGNSFGNNTISANNESCLLVGGNGISLSGNSNGTISIIADTCVERMIFANTSGGTTGTIVGQTDVYLYGGNNVTLSMNANSVTINGAAGGAGTPVSYFANVYPVASTQTYAVQSNSSLVAPFIIREDNSFQFMRMPMFLATNSTGLTNTTSNTVYTCGWTSTFNNVIYTRGTGASSMSLMSVMSTSNSMVRSVRISLAAGNNSQYSITEGITYPIFSGTSSLSWGWSGSSSTYNMTGTNLSIFASFKYIDIPWASSLSAGQYFLGHGVQTSNATQVDSRASRYGWSVGHVFAGVPQVQTTAGMFGAVTNTSFQLYPALGTYTNAATGTQPSIPMANISGNVSNILPFIQLMNYP